MSDVPLATSPGIDRALVGADAVCANALRRTFGERVAVDGIDLSVRPGELFALLGPNGAGKTTMLKMLCCLLKPSGGTARVMDRDVREDPLGVKQIIAISPQETAVAERLDARENLALMAGIHGVGAGEAAQRSDELLELMGLSDRAGERVKHYSGGMKRRLSIAMALVSDPQVLFLDEPTLGLDPQARRKVWEHIGTLKSRRTVLLTTHYLEEADSLADRVGIIDEGRMVALGTPDELKKSVSEKRTLVVRAKNLTAEVIAGLRERYREVAEIEGGVEITAAEFDVYALQDYLRPKGVVVESTQLKETTLDDVFLHLTGREFRD